MVGGAPPVPAIVDYAVSLGEQQDVPAIRSPLRRLLPSLRRRNPSPTDFPDFDPNEYLRLNPDVAAAGVPPLLHYATRGWLEGRRLFEGFNLRRYLAAHPRARQALLEIQAARWPKGSAVPFSARQRHSPRLPGVLIVGYVEANLGLGESSRGLAHALAQTDVPFGIYPYNWGVEHRYLEPFMPERTDKTRSYEIVLFEANGDQLAPFLEQFAHRLEGSHAIFRTYWELADAPSAWARNLARFGEIWAPTRFVAEAYRRVFDGPITLVPPCVSARPIETGKSVARDHFSLPAEPFLFLQIFDYSSVAERKNPLGVVQAFRAAFPEKRDDVGLVLKATGAPDLATGTRAALANAARQDRRIIILDETMSRDDVLSLVHACDAFVSLHRSEGFGFGMAEAMALGRPVIATDYSGSTDFVSDRTGWPVAYRLRPVRNGQYPHGEGQLWAEPDLRGAAEVMKRVHADRAERERRSSVGRRFVAERFGQAQIGRIAGERLRDILRMRGG